MLDKLLNFDLTKLQSPMYLEYWVKKLREGEEIVMVPINETMFKEPTDEYMTAIMTTESNSAAVNVIKLLVNKRSEIIGGVVSPSDQEIMSNSLTSFIIMLKETLKLCSRLFDFPTSDVCSTMQNMTMKDNSTNDSSFNEVFMEPFLYDNDYGTTLYAYESCTNAFWRSLRYRIENKIEIDCDRPIFGHPSMNQILGEVMPNCRAGIDYTFNFACNICSKVCLASNQYIDRRFTFNLYYTAGLATSTFFLLATLSVYLILPRLRATVHGKCITCHLASMLVGYGCLTIVQLQFLQNIFCQIIGFTMQFGFLAMFFWLNVTCFDISLSFCNLKVKRQNCEDDRRKLLWYHCYGWGGPLIILAATIFFQYLDLFDYDHYLTPDMGGPKCFFKSSNAQWLFLYFPIGILILINLLMFAVTAVMIYKHSKDTEILRNPGNAAFNKTNWNRLKVYVNLFILMGAYWGTEVLSWTVTFVNVTFLISDVMTTLQGLFVFILFVVKPSVLNSLRHRFHSLRREREEQPRETFQLLPIS